MDQRRNHADRNRSTNEPSSTPRPNAWVIGVDGNDCDHDAANLRHVGDDGLASYYHCERCGSVLVAREPIRRSVRAIT